MPVFLFDYEVKTDGMAGNVYNNIKALNIDSDLVISTRNVHKVRFVDIKSKQHLMRADYENIVPELIINYDSLNNYNAIIISDYNKGSVTKNIYDTLRKIFAGPIFVDSKKNDLSIFDHENTIIKINDQEYLKANKLPIISPLIITKGDKGAFYNGDMYSTKKVEVFDLSGAGDSFLAGLATQYILTKDIKESIKFANLCASNVVKKTGTSIIDFEEVKNDLCF